MCFRKSSWAIPIRECVISILCTFLVLSSLVKFVILTFIPANMSFAATSNQQLPINRIDEINSLLPDCIIFHVSHIAVKYHILWRTQIILRPIRQSAVATTCVWILVIDERDVRFPNLVRQVGVILVFWERAKSA